jgi:hypothetical protein
MPTDIDMTKLVVAFAVLRVCLKIIRHVNLFSGYLSYVFSDRGSKQLVLRLQNRQILKDLIELFDCGRLSCDTLLDYTRL